jgi:PAS domain S-box-containing protein
LPGFKASIRDKLIGIFILIKVIPLIVLAWFAWNEISTLASTLENHVNEMAETSAQTTRQVANLATTSSIRALDLRSREAIERLTTDTALSVAAFLKDRDEDIQLASLLPAKEKIYEKFLNTQKRNIILHDPWIMNEKGDAWIPATPFPAPDRSVTARNKENELDFHYRSLKKTGKEKKIPLFLEITFVDLLGKEQIKVTSSDILPKKLNDISQKDQTFCRAETYFKELQKLKPGEIYVSEVIGTYLKAHMIGPYTKAKASQMGIDFNPEQSGYAGKENPVGKRFQGLIRWAMPVVEKGKIKGYVTLALDHTHIMGFTDHIVPTEERYSAISDAASGNYAFMWDAKGRNISHPRDYFIAAGYDPGTGEPAMPWLEDKFYKNWEKSNLNITEFLKKLPEYENQSHTKPPSKDLIQQGFLGLDCRYLNFAPQCDGWNNITQHGGSGSFVIHWSGLKKLTTAATIPYHTGQYGKSPRGFGFVTIGANVDEFHKAANITAKNIKDIEKKYVKAIEGQNQKNQEEIVTSLQQTASRLSLYTGAMILIVMIIAVLMASTLTGIITRMIKGISRFQKGDMKYRLDIQSSDEMGELGHAFNSMADSMDTAISNLEQSKLNVEDSNVSLRAMLSNIINSMPSCIIGVDTQARVTLWNTEAQTLTGKSFEQAEKQIVFDVFPLLTKEKSIIFHALENGEIKKEQRIEITLNNERLFYDVTVYPLVTSRIDGAVIRIDNITNRINMEEMMIQTEKMQSIGSLAAGMAHEINNPLAGIIQSAQVIQNRTKPDMLKNQQEAEHLGIDLEKLNTYMENRRIFQMLSSILDAGRRAADIVTNMLTFSRKSTSSYSSLDISRILDQTIDIMEKDYDLNKHNDFKKIKILREYSQNLPHIPCDVSKIQQVFFNILKNGAQAMIKNPEKISPIFTIKTALYSDSVLIEIQDNGPGMDEDTKTRIFEPFYTTKSVGVGTGLGLYISYFIVVENHRGTINVESFPGRGTKFIINLPLHQDSNGRSI